MLEERENAVRARLQDIARLVQAKLPNDWGFILLTFPFGQQGSCLYVSNANRDDAIQAMREFIAKNKNAPQPFTDQGTTTADSAFDSWWQKEVTRLDITKLNEAGLRQLAFDAFIAGMVWGVA